MAVKRINLALQGGGAHGAFTWGALDRLLEEPELEIAGISGTSAGALNGAALKAGMCKGGRDAARDNLAWLWEQVMGNHDPVLNGWMSYFDAGAISRAMEYSLPLAAMQSWTHNVSPYAYGPLYRNPLADIVGQFDFETIQHDKAPFLNICATRVRNGKIRIFQGKEITADAIMASACLPTLFKAVEIEDRETGQLEAFWDGGYTGNPALFPLFDKQLPDDIVIININPLERDEIPKSPQQIQNRINEISFNSSLLRELRAIEFVQRLLDDGTVSQGRMSRVRVHMIADDALMNDLSVATKMVPSKTVIETLRDAGRNAADAFLRDCVDNIGQKSSVDLPEMFG